jgi:alkylhydroperoxidase/carboxymuconolactone decarboxylase family protein YurZ
MLEEAGFTEARLTAETGFNSTGKTKGVLFHAAKPKVIKTVPAEKPMKDSPMQEPLDRYKEFFEAAYADGALDRKTKHLAALAASLAAGCDP